MAKKPSTERWADMSEARKRELRELGLSMDPAELEFFLREQLAKESGRAGLQTPKHWSDETQH